MTATATTIASTIATTLAPPAPLGLQDPPHTATGQLHYGLRWIGSRCFLAADAPGGTRIVEAFGNVAEAEHIAVLVPGNGHNLGNYFTDKGPNSPSERGRLLLRAMRELDPGARCAVVVWVGYDAPANLASAADNRPAHHGAPDLVRLTQFLPSHAHITLVGHSYGTTVCGLALADPRTHADDCIAVGSPGMGVRCADEFFGDTTIWAAQGPSDWIRHFPHGQIGHLGLGTPPLDRRIGARRIDTGEISGHCSYFLAGTESLRNVVAITMARYTDVPHEGVTHEFAFGPGQSRLRSRVGQLR